MPPTRIPTAQRETAEPPCEECSGRGWKVEPDGGAGRARPCGCQQSDPLELQLERAGVPTRYRRFTRAAWEAAFGAWSASPLLSRLEGWPRRGGDPDEWAVSLYGLYGRRKTSLGTAIFSEALLQERRGLWLDMNDWLDSLEAAMGTEDGAVARLFTSARDVDVLMIDDLAAVRRIRDGSRSNVGVWWREKVATLLRHREAWCKPTVFTCNLLGKPDHGSAPRRQENGGGDGPAPTEFWPDAFAVIDPSLVSRFRELPLAIELQGPNYRTAGRRPQLEQHGSNERDTR